MKRILLFTGIVFVMLLCSTAPNSQASAPAPSPVKKVNCDGRYQMMLPTYLNRDSTLNNEASLQYSNIYKEVYLIVIDEPKQEFIDIFTGNNEYDTSKTALENYAHAQLESINAVMKQVTALSEKRTLKTGSADAIVFDVAGTQEGVNGEMGFTVGFIEGKLNLYMIMMWTFSSSTPMYQQDFDAAISSFKELSGAINTFPYAITSGQQFMRIPASMSYDSTLSSQAGISYSDPDRNLFVVVEAYPLDEWTDSYKEGPMKTYPTVLDYFVSVQREGITNDNNSSNKLSPITASKGKMRTSRFFTVTQSYPNSEEAWYHKFRVVLGSSNIYVVDSSCPLRLKAENEKDMDMMLNTFNEL